jgi:hypothetical protein
MRRGSEITRQLPARVGTAAEFTPVKPGAHEFPCGMHMLRGRIVVKKLRSAPMTGLRCAGVEHIARGLAGVMITTMRLDRGRTRDRVVAARI